MNASLLLLNQLDYKVSRKDINYISIPTSSFPFTNPALVVCLYLSPCTLRQSNRNNTCFDLLLQDLDEFSPTHTLFVTGDFNLTLQELRKLRHPSADELLQLNCLQPITELSRNQGSRAIDYIFASKQPLWQ